MTKKSDNFRLTAAPDAKWRDDDEVVRPTFCIGAVMRCREATSRTATVGAAVMTPSEAMAS